MEDLADSKQEGGALIVLKWILGGLCTIIFGAGTAWLSHIDAELGTIRVEQQSKIAKVAMLEAKVEDTSNRLARIEDKLDVILDRLPHR